jgi:hypothetical protein
MAKIVRSCCFALMWSFVFALGFALGIHQKQEYIGAES